MSQISTQTIKHQSSDKVIAIFLTIKLEMKMQVKMYGLINKVIFLFQSDDVNKLMFFKKI